MPKAIFNIAFTAKNPPQYLMPNKRAEYIARRNFYNLSADYNYFSYALNGKKTAKNKDFLAYGERSFDAFNMSGPISEAKKERIKKALKTTESHIWHGVISFDEETSKGFETPDKAAHFLKQTFNSFLEHSHFSGARGVKGGVSDNIEMLATLHNDTENRHIHFIFFEKEPKHRDKNGNLTFTQKGTFSQRALDNYLVSANMYLSEYSEEYFSARDKAMAKLKELRETGYIEKQSFKSAEVNELRRDLTEFSKKLPAGKWNYNAKNMTGYRREIDKLALRLLRAEPEAAQFDKELRIALAQKEKEAKELCSGDVRKELVYVQGKALEDEEIRKLLSDGKTEYIRENRIDWNNIDYFERLRQDYKARLGNQVLNLCRDIHKDRFRSKNRTAFNDKSKKIESRILRRYAKNTMRKFMNSLSGYQRGITADFTARLHEIEREIQSEQRTKS